MYYVGYFDEARHEEAKGKVYSLLTCGLCGGDSNKGSAIPTADPGLGKPVKYDKATSSTSAVELGASGGGKKGGEASDDEMAAWLKMKKK